MIAMFEAALNPLAWWGLTLLSVPILIHLLNRLRYKRLRWAAMEFLLQAQKKYKRRIILEQVLLLLVRCFLVASVVALVARPTWLLDAGTRGSNWPHFHVVLLDDSLSMQDLADARTPQGATAFTAAQRLLLDLAQQHAESKGQHFWILLRWTDPQVPELGRPVPQEPPSAGEAPLGQPVTEAELSSIRIKLEGLKPSAVAASPLPALRQALRYLERVQEGYKHVHLVSDFRRVDWLDAASLPVLQTLGEALQRRTRVHCHDVALPPRTSVAAETPADHGHAGIVDVIALPRRPGDEVSGHSDIPLRVVTPRAPFDLRVTVRNFGTTERRHLRLQVATGSVTRASRVIDRLGGREERTFALTLEFPLSEPPGSKPLTIRLEDPDQGDHLPADNVWRHVVELRRDIRVLVIDGEQRPGANPADAWFVESALAASPRTGYVIDRLAPKELARQTDLSPYGVVYLLNVAGVGTNEAEIDPKALPVLTQFVARGGCLVFFLGPRTNVISFNEQWYQRGEGLFPVPLLQRPDPEGRSALSFIDEPPDDRDAGPKLRFPSDSHPALPFAGETADLLSRYLLVNRYFRVDPAWKPPAGTSVLVRLVNRQPLALYVPEVQQLLAGLRAISGAAAATLARHEAALTEAITDAESRRARKTELVLALEALLQDPQLTTVWQGRGQELRNQAEKLLGRLREGDPLLIESRGPPGSQRGRVVVCLTPAAPTPIRGRDYGWNNFGAGDLGQYFFVPLLLSLQDYLQSWSLAAQHQPQYRLGEMAELRLNQQRYEPQIEVWFEGDDGEAARKVNTITAEPAPAAAGSLDVAEWLVRVAPLQGPGHYRLRLNQPKPSATPIEGPISLDPAQAVAKAPPEERPLAFNVDSRQEGWLSRFAETELRDKLVQSLTQGSARLPLAEVQQAVQRLQFQVSAAAADEEATSISWSDFSWVFFAFVLLLLLEQALGKRFSHHQ